MLLVYVCLVLRRSERCRSETVVACRSRETGPSSGDEAAMPLFDTQKMFEDASVYHEDQEVSSEDEGARGETHDRIRNMD